jgi:aminoglycoside phosphotransferase (APT) family kinase protein
MVDLTEAEMFLREHYDGSARGCEPLGGGDWSRAFAFRLGPSSLVVRFGMYREDYMKDRQAMTFAGPDLPVPHVLEIGDAFGGAYAISERHFGVFLETLDEPRFRRLLPALLRGLDALRELPQRPTAVIEPGGVGDVAAMGWHEWLTDSLMDWPGGRVSGWRAALADEPQLDGLFTAAEEAMQGLFDTCPDDRHVLHSDLLNRNVLVSDDGSRLEAVFDWGCSIAGDFLYEVAWLTFWAPWFPGLAAVDIRAAVLAHYGALNLAVPFFDERLRCYELHVGLLHLAYSTFTGRHDERNAIAERTSQVLDSDP